jgi:periplasmic divalent cation tolerance protein
MNNLILIYITVPSSAKATEIAQYLVEKKLLACATLVSAKSLYWWHMQCEQADEIIIIGKTMRLLHEQLEQAVMSMHPYQTPCILTIPITANQSYARYVHDTLRPSSH